MSGIAAAAIAGGAALLGTAGSAYSAGRLNKRGERFSREMYGRQREDALSDWHMMNAYNDPSAVMQRLRDAGLNPNLVYGHGAQSQTTMTPQASSHKPTYHKPHVDLGSVAQQAISTQQAMSNIRRTDAETDAIKERTSQQIFENNVREILGHDVYASLVRSEELTKSIASSKEAFDYDAWQAGSFTDEKGQRYETTSPQSPIAKAIRSGYYETVVSLENAYKMGDMYSFKNEVHKFEANLAKQGISPNTPWYAKILADIITKVTGKSVFQLLNSQDTDLIQSMFK